MTLRNAWASWRYSAAAAATTHLPTAAEDPGPAAAPRPAQAAAVPAARKRAPEATAELRPVAARVPRPVECVPIYDDYGQSGTGACYDRGTVAEGQSCTAIDVNTGCVAGSLCVKDPNSYVCRKECKFFTGTPGCSGSQRCVASDVCVATTGDSAAIGQACSSSSTPGKICGNDGNAWRGVCKNAAPDGGINLVCLKICRTAAPTDCASGQTCVAFAKDSTAGVCY